MALRFSWRGGVAALATGAVVLSLLATYPLKAAETRGAQKPRKQALVVTVTKGFRHDSIPTAEKTIQQLGEETKDWETDFVRTDAEMQEKMTADALKKYDVVIFANTTGVLPLPDPNGFLEYIKSGKGFVAMHSGSDTFPKWPGGAEGQVSEYVKMLGGEFLTHGRQCAVDAMIIDPKHPAMAPVVKAGKNPPATMPDLKQNTYPTGTTWKIFDEMYQLKNVDRANLRVLLKTDAGFDDGTKNAGVPGENLIAWCRAYGKGRVFYTSLGHRQEMWRDPIYQQHITGGIRFALGLAKGAIKPNPVSASALVAK